MFIVFQSVKLNDMLCIYADGNSVVMKTEVDNNDIIEDSHDDGGQTNTGTSDVFDFIHSFIRSLNQSTRNHKRVCFSLMHLFSVISEYSHKSYHSVAR